MAETTAAQPKSLAGRLKAWIVPALILLMAVGIVFLIAGNWNAWASDKAEQETDDAYTRADMTPLSTKVAGLVATVAVSDYRSVKAGDLLVQLRDDDFQAQVQQAEAGVASGQDALINNQRQKELQDARIVQAVESLRASDAQIKAADAGIAAANSTIANARSAINGTNADVERTRLERRRQVWRRDGKELYYRTPDGHLDAVEVHESVDSVSFTAAHDLFRSTALSSSASVGYYDVSPDGKRFLLLVPVESGTSGKEMTVLINWRADLKK